MKNTLCFALLLSVTSALAQDNKYPDIYPYKASSREDIRANVIKFTEDENYESNISAMMKPELINGKADLQPWTSFYWQIGNGLIADDYRRSFTNARLVTSLVFWKKRIKRFNRRFKKKLSEAYSLDQRQLDKLAPSEKYDLALGDLSFNLTHRLWDFSSKWGQEKEFAYITKAAIPQNYVLTKKNKLIGLWEGICHGWAVAATVLPRPSKTVELQLPNGKMIRFFPEDVKALASLTFANSNIQNPLFKADNGDMLGGSIFGDLMGLRCYQKDPAKDEWGRFHDPKPYSGRGEYEVAPGTPGSNYEARCIGVHPAVWHLGAVNTIGIQGRSFVADIDANDTVNNHPIAGYNFNYFNPMTTESKGGLNKLMVAVENYPNDPFKDFRHQDTRFIIGVQAKMNYTNWAYPDKDETNTSKDDDIKSREFIYDLELDAKGNIIGGQWRLSLDGVTNLNSNVEWPDFMWKITKNWKKEFKGESGLTAWNDKRRVPPADWKNKALNMANKYHNYTYTSYGFGGDWANQRCRVVHKNDKSKTQEVKCDIRFPRPQPLVNFVNELIDLAK